MWSLVRIVCYLILNMIVFCHYVILILNVMINILAISLCTIMLVDYDIKRCDNLADSNLK